MANVLGNYNVDLFANEALIWLSKALGFSSRVHRGFDAERASFGLGDTIKIRRPGKFAAQDAGGSRASVTTESVEIKLTTHREVRFEIKDAELAWTGQRIIDEHIMPAAYGLADDIDQGGWALFSTIPHTVSVASTKMGVVDITTVAQKMFDNQVPMAAADQGLLRFGVGSLEKNELLQLDAFNQFQGAGMEGVALQTTGNLGRKFGFDFFTSQNRPTHVAGTYAETGTPALAADAALGATSITIDSTTLTGTLKPGDVILIDGDPHPYTPAALATASANAITVTLAAPGLRQASVDTTAVTITPEATNTLNNIAFHRDAFALGFAALPQFENFSNRGLGADIRTVTDPISGLSVRARIYSDPDVPSIVVVLDALWGWKTLNEDLAVRFLNA
jgi:hypothetical protein